MKNLFRKSNCNQVIGCSFMILDLKFLKGKFHTLWMGPYEVIRVFENGAVEFKTIDGKNSVFLVNGHRLKKYFQPLARKYFTQQVQQQFGTVVVNGNTNLFKT